MKDFFGFFRGILKKITEKSSEKEYAEIRSKTRQFKDLDLFGSKHLDDAIEKQVAEWKLKGEDRSGFNPLDSIESQAARVVAARLHAEDLKKAEFVLKNLKNKDLMSPEETSSWVEKFLEQKALGRKEQYKK